MCKGGRRGDCHCQRRRQHEMDYGIGGGQDRGVQGQHVGALVVAEPTGKDGKGRGGGARGVAAVPSCHYVGRMGCHIYGWSARQCRTHLGYTRKVRHQMGIFQITTLSHLQGTVH
jgi:hypothetical protein